MSKRTIYTIITPLPSTISRETVLAAFHDHALMIELNPLVISHTPVKPPRFAEADEYHSAWYEIHDRVHYLPGGMASGKVIYHACCHDLPKGLQTHCYAALGTNIRGKWLLCGTLPGEPRETPELGVKAPAEGLYVREDIDMKCNFMMTGFVKKNLEKAHGALLARLIAGARIVEGVARGDGEILGHRPIPSVMIQRESMKQVLEQKRRQSSAPVSPELPRPSPRFSSAIATSGYESPSSIYSLPDAPVQSEEHPFVAELSAEKDVSEQGPRIASSSTGHHDYVAPLKTK